MRITYVGFGDFHHHAGMKQLYHFAQEICRLGNEAQILLPGDPLSANAMEESPLASLVPISFNGPILARSVSQKVRAFRPDILHVWTPRHVPALTGWQLGRTTTANVILNHEDDENYHTANYYRSTIRKWSGGLKGLVRPLVLARNAGSRWLTPIRNDGLPYYGAQESITLRGIANMASAHTAISPNLVAWAKRHWPDRPVHLLYPGANLDMFTPNVVDMALRKSLGLVGSRVLVYAGTLNLSIFRWFLNVLQQVISEFSDVKLLLVGEDAFRDEAEQLARELGLQEHYLLLGQQSYANVPRYLSLGHILLQHPLDLGNDMRLPAKLPEYLAMGKPIITFAAGIGRTFADGVHVRKLTTVDPNEAAFLVMELLQDPAQCHRLGAAARSIVSERFDWTKNGKALSEIYNELLRNAKNHNETPRHSFTWSDTP